MGASFVRDAAQIAVCLGWNTQAHPRAIDPEAGTVPELYYSNSDKPNENNPLGWAESMYVIALIKVRDME